MDEEPVVPTPPAPSDAPPTARMQTYQEMVADRDAPRHPGDGGGTWRALQPVRTQVGQRVSVPTELEVGPHGIDLGGALVVVPSPFWGWSAPQGKQPEAPGYTTFTGPEGVTFDLQPAGGQLRAVVGGRALQSGERVQITYGAGDTAIADRFAERAAAVWLGVDADGDGVRALVAEPVTAEVRAGPPAQIVATWPSAAAPGDTVDLVLAVLDANGNAFGRHATELTLAAAEGLQLPSVVRLDEGDEGLARVPVTVERPGVHTVDVTALGGRFRSNPMVVREGAVPILWGDLQIHSALSDGTGDPTDLWRYAREVAALDVAAITDHDHWGMRFLDGSPALREQLDRAVAAAHEPGRFVAVHGYEYTDWRYGHRHVLAFDGPLPVFSALDPATDTPQELWAALTGRQALTVPHHPAGGPVAVDPSVTGPPELEPVIEMTSVHGQSDHPSLPQSIYDAVPGTFVFERLVAGDRFGLIGSTDGHDGHPGLSHLVGGRGGLVALPATERTRAGVYQALRARRTYATNGRRIVLRVDADGSPMGAEIPAGPVTLTVRVVGTAPLDRVEVVGPAGVVASQPGGSTTLYRPFAVELADSGFLYVRVIQADGGLAWSSPVFTADSASAQAPGR